MTDGGVLDSRALDELRANVGGDPEFVAELIDEFLEDAPRQLESLRTAASAGDAEAARRAAHTLKGNARTFGAAELAARCLEAESAAAEGDLATVHVRADTIAESWRDVRAELLAARSG